MAGGKNNTQKIEILESQAANMQALLAAHEIILKGIDELLRKSVASAEGHTSKITIIEERIVVLGDLKGALASIVSIEKELVAFRKDLENLQQWKRELNKDKDEAKRRLWAFGPNVLAAVIGGIVAFIVAFLKH